MAEEMGLISELTRSVIERAIKDCSKWESRIAVSVNLSSHDLQNMDMVKSFIPHCGGMISSRICSKWK